MQLPARQFQPRPQPAGLFYIQTMEACPNCGCISIGTDVLYAHGIAMFCQDCGVRGPREPIDPMEEMGLVYAEAEAKAKWNELARRLKVNVDQLGPVTAREMHENARA